MELPEPYWLSLFETRKLVISKTNAEPVEVEISLLSAFREGKIQTRGRCRSYGFHKDLSMVPIYNFTWDQEDVNWEESSFVIPASESWMRPHEFTDVEVSRQSILGWLERGEGESAPEASLASGNKPKRRGRKKGEGSYKDKDMPLVEKMNKLHLEGRTVHAAAVQFAGKAVGSGVFESKVKRLMERYKEKYQNK